MATLQKLRKNKITPIAIGVAMLLFVVTLFLKQGGSQGERNAAVLNGKELDIAKFNEMVEEAKDVFVTMGQLPENPDNQTMTQLREMVYQNYISSQMLEEECERLGITVTTAELQNIIKNGSNQVLMQTPFRTQQGTFDYASLQQFLKQYQDMQKNSAQIPAEQREYFERIYRMWIYTEKELRKSVLMEKYQVLLGSLILSNPVSAKAAFEARNNETDVLLAALPYTSIEDKDVKVEESDVKAKYEEYKDFFFRPSQTRDIKYIDVVIKASKEDEEALNKDMAEYAAQLRDSSLSVENVVRRSQSSISYSALPLSKKAFPRDIAARFDSMAVGSQCAPYYNAADNTMNIIKMMGKVMRPDSVEVREIAATGKDLAAAKKTADSIYNALQAGANFDTIAKAYNQPATKHWITSNMYEGSQINEENRKYLEVVTTAAANSLNKIELGAGVIIVEVTDRRNMQDKYNVAVIKREMNFSNKTTNDNFNKLSSFIASHKTVKEMEENSKGEFSILPCNEFNAMTAAVPGIEESREVIRWAYNEETKVGDVSEIFYCGKKREHLVVAVLEAIHDVKFFAYQFSFVFCSVLSLLHMYPVLLAESPNLIPIIIVGILINGLWIIVIPLLFCAPVLHGLCGLAVHLLEKCTFLKKRALFIEKVRTFENDFSSYTAKFKSKMRYVLLAVLLSIPQVVLQMSVLCVVFRAFSCDAPYLELLCMQTMLQAAVCFVPLPGASGAQEFGFSMFFKPYFSSGDVLYTAVLVWRFFTYYLIVILGALLVVFDQLLYNRKRRKAANN